MIRRSALFVTCFVVSALAGCASDPPPAATSATSATTCTSSSSSADANKALVERLYAEVWDKRNPDAALSGIVATDLVNHAAIPEAQGAEGMRTLTKKLFAAFPDMTTKRLDVVAEGDRVVVRTLVEGTQTGDLAFKHPIPATGKHVSIEQVHIYRLAGGKIVEMWMWMDHADLNKQLGLSPASKEGGAS